MTQFRFTDNPAKLFNKNEQEVDGKGYELSDIFNRYGDRYISNNNVPTDHIKVIEAIRNCRTYKAGFHLDVCDKCGHTEFMPNSCRNRNCPKCQGSNRMNWVASRLEDLLPVAYYHSVFTLPDMIFPLCLYNQKAIYDLLFRSSSATLHDFAKDQKWLGAEIGFYGILHTWGQTLGVHPHIHYIVTGGGVTEDGKWASLKYDGRFLFPVKALSIVFRGKFVEGLKKLHKSGKLVLPTELAELKEEVKFEKWIDKFVARNWVVYAKAPFGGPEDVIRYIGRYTHRVAISNSRIISIDDDKIKFSYKNYKKRDSVSNSKELWEEMELPVDDFIRRFLYHILPSGYHRIRYFGFLRGNQKERLQEIWEELVFEEELGLPDVEIEDYIGIMCPKCFMGIMTPVVFFDRYGYVVEGNIYDVLKDPAEIYEYNTS